MTEIVRVDPRAPDPDAIQRAAECLARGGLVAFPTETVYGLGAHALDRSAIGRLFAAKGRPASDPLIVHIAGAEQLAALVSQVPDSVEHLAARFWPGPLTLVLPRAEIVPLEVSAGLATVGVRVPAHPIAQALLAAAAMPIAAPSANLFSRPSPTQAAHVLEDLRDRIDMVLDGGPTIVGVESTVLDLSGDVPTILRPGAIGLEALREVLPEVRSASTQRAVSSGPMPSPGLLTKHYAPRAPLTLYEGECGSVAARIAANARAAIAGGARVGLVLTDEDRERVAVDGVEIARLGSERDVSAIASRLYSALRDLDASGVDVILAAAPPGREGLALAIHDRLRRAAAGRIVNADAGRTSTPNADVKPI